jgi:predicted AAA+ superfamily ATPase
MKTIERQKYIDLIFEERKQHRILLLAGLHGVGKTTLLNTASHALKGEQPPVRILHIKPEDGIANGQDLVLASRALGVGKSALFLDNADLVEDLPKALAEILDKYTATIFLSGRNTNVLRTELEPPFGKEGQNELSTIRVNPLSYGEFLEAWDLSESREAFELYARSGGLPQSLMIDPRTPAAGDFARIRADAFILTELVEPNGIRNPAHLRELLSIAAQCTGSAIPARLVRDSFADRRITISPQAAIDYLGLCEKSGILVPVPVLDLDKKRTLDSADVWYFGDSGLRAPFVKKDTAAEFARAEENLAYLKLVDDGWSVRRGRIGFGRQMKEDISFVCERNGKRVYAQMIPNTATSGERLRKREALLAVRDAWPRFLIEAVPSEGDNDGITELLPRELLLSGLPA